MEEMSEWTCEGDLKPMREYTSTGSLPVIRRVHIVSMQTERIGLPINQGGTAEVVRLLSLWGQKLFLLQKIRKRSEENVLSGL